MKKYIFLSVIVSMTFMSLNGQVFFNQDVVNQIPDENAFLDASSSFNTEVSGNDNSIGKGLIFPTVDLTTFEFILDNAGFTLFQTYFNGMIVYNSATGKTKTTGNRSSSSTDVTPGFYYFYNPEGHINQNVTDGIWLPLGNSAAYTSSSGKDTLFVYNENGGRDTILLGGVRVSLTKDTLFIPNPGGGIDTVPLYLGGGGFGKVGGDRGISVNFIQDSVGISLPEGTQPGDVLTWDSDIHEWTAKSKTQREYIWLPAVNLPWNTSGNAHEIDLFEIYQQSFDPTGGGGVPKPDGNGKIPTQNNVNYISSTGLPITVPGHAGATRDMFDYVVTYFDNSVVKIVHILPSGKLKYEPAYPGILPPANAFISVMLIRREN